MEQKLENYLKRLNDIERDFTTLKDSNNKKYEDIVKSITSFKDNIDAIETEFEKLTNLQNEDYVFILFCAGLQACRQYFITDFQERLSDKEAASEVKGKVKEKSNRNKTRYYCSLTNIISNPVPFDAIEHNEKIKPGISGFNHRTKCLGHYPILGYVFGTANIMTSTLTIKEAIMGVKTFHVKTENIEQVRYYKKSSNSKVYSFQKDFINAEAHTDLMFNHCYERIKNNPKEGLSALLAALAKEHQHLRSDEKTKKGLPFPLLNFTPEIAECLSEYGFDYLNFKTVLRQSAYSYMVNLITEILYYAYQVEKNTLITSKDESMKGNVLITDSIKVRLKKIINVSNVIATSSNLSAVLCGVLMGNSKIISKLDIGGELMTLYSLSQSADFMIKVKKEYVLQKIELLNNK